MSFQSHIPMQFFLINWNQMKEQQSKRRKKKLTHPLCCLSPQSNEPMTRRPELRLQTEKIHLPFFLHFLGHQTGGGGKRSTMRRIEMKVPEAVTITEGRTKSPEPATTAHLAQKRERERERDRDEARKRFWISFQVSKFQSRNFFCEIQILFGPPKVQRQRLMSPFRPIQLKGLQLPPCQAHPNITLWSNNYF